MAKLQLNKHPQIREQVMTAKYKMALMYTTGFKGRYLLRRRKYRACLCGQKMAITPLFCLWLEVTKMLCWLLFPLDVGPDLPNVLYPKETSEGSQISKVHPASLISSVSVIWTPLVIKEQDQ